MVDVYVVQVMYDASGVRLHAGRQASVLNMIITELPPDHPVSDTRPLRDSLGHTPLQVCGRPSFLLVSSDCMPIALTQDPPVLPPASQDPSLPFFGPSKVWSQKIGLGVC